MKNTKNWSLWGSLLSLSLFGIFVSVFGLNHTNEQFSVNSLRALKELNAENQMFLDDLILSESSSFGDQLYKANVLISDAEAQSTNKGLIVSLENEGGVLLLQPSKKLSDPQLEAVGEKYMKAIPEFEHVEVDQNVEVFDEPVYDWVFNPGPEVELTAESPTEPKVRGSVLVAVVDTGVDANHEIFETQKVLPGFNTFDNNKSAFDDVGHGTHVAGIIAEHVDDVTIIPYKIVDKNGGRLSNVVSALNQAIDDHVDVVNTSFGLLSDSYALELLVERMDQEGIILVAAAGNNGTSKGFYPASYTKSIAVASLDRNNNKLAKSNFGTWVDTAAYGYFVRSSLPNNLYGVKSGTSQAAPVVTAAVAELLKGEDPENPYDFKDILRLLMEEGQVIQSGPLAGVTIVK